MNSVAKAMAHVRQHHPKVTQVFYSVNGKWLYCDDDFEAPAFGPEIDTGLLEDGADDVIDCPCAFHYLGLE